MNAGWAAVIGAVVGSAVSGGVIFLRDWIEARRRRVAEGRDGAEAVLAYSMAVVQYANALRMTMKLRSGMQDAIDVLLRQRKPLDVFDITDRADAAFQPLFAAQATAVAKGSKEAVPLVNAVVARCVALVDVATQGGRAGTAFSRYVLGERWTDEQERSYEEAAKDIGESRRKLATRLREEGGAEPLPDVLA